MKLFKQSFKSINHPSAVPLVQLAGSQAKQRTLGGQHGCLVVASHVTGILLCHWLHTYWPGQVYLGPAAGTIPHPVMPPTFAAKHRQAGSSGSCRHLSALTSSVSGVSKYLSVFKLSIIMFYILLHYSLYLVICWHIELLFSYMPITQFELLCCSRVIFYRLLSLKAVVFIFLAMWLIQLSDCKKPANCQWNVMKT
jgi:hypothetical protein